MHKDSEKTWLAHLAEDRRYAAMAGLGFSSGLPFLLAYSTQSAAVGSGRANRDDWPPQRAHYRLKV
jgi:hypothetical protein